MTLLEWGYHCLSVCLHFILSGPLVKWEEPRPREPRAEGRKRGLLEAWEQVEGDVGGGLGGSSSFIF